ncbi:MAG: PAS domain S-box protein [Candidatus Rokuibacteriota bacterium]
MSRHVDPLAGVLGDLQQFIDRLPSAVCVSEAPSGVIRLYNRRAAELWGREPKLGDANERFCGSWRLFRTDERLLAHADAPMGEVLRTGRPADDVVVMERPDGSRVTAHVAVGPLRDPEGRLVGAVNVFQDITDREGIGQALRQSEVRDRVLVEEQPDLVCRFRPDGTLTFANDAYCRYFGVRREDAVGAPYTPFVYPDDVPRVGACVASLSPTNRVAVVESRVVRGDGALRWTEWTNHAVYDEHDRVLEFHSTGRDLTERRQAGEDAARLSAIVANADDAIVSQTLDGVITSWNGAAERMFGYTAREAVGQSIALTIPSERREEEVGILARLKRGEAIDHFETERVSKDGRRISISLTVSPVRDLSGRIIGVSTIARDISERRGAEEDLARHVRTLEVLYRLADHVGRARGVTEVCDAAVDAIMAAGRADRASLLVLDETGRMRFRDWRGLSDRYRAAVDGHSPWSPDAGDPAPILIEDVLADSSLGALRDTMAAEGIRTLSFTPLVYQGRLLGEFGVYWNGPHAFSQRELRVTATIAHHVAFGLARAQAEAAIDELLGRERAAHADADAARADAERANQAKDEFLAMLAHELRNPLGVIAHAVAVIEGTPNGPPELGRVSAMIRRQTNHLARLLDDLLDVARITSGRIELDRERVNLHAAVEAGVDAQRHAIDRKRQQVFLSLPAEPVAVVGDAVRLQQVLGNLLSNASKYTPAGGSIWVTLGVDGGEAVLRVRDDGAGIPPDKLHSIFDLFTQVNPTLARSEGGLGIGLTLVKRVVELHGGAVSAHSDGAGRGAELLVRLPLVGAPSAPAPPPSAPVVAPPRRILVIEDHDDGREMLATMLRLSGHEVLEAAAGGEGLETAARHSPDVVLVDIGLPDVDGYEVGQRLRRTFGGSVRLVALTGYGQPQDRARSAQAGFDDHLVKPVDAPRLAEVLRRLTS